MRGDLVFKTWFFIIFAITMFIFGILTAISWVNAYLPECEEDELLGTENYINGDVNAWDLKCIHIPLEDQ